MDLFAHAEVLENVIEGFLGGDSTTGDFGKNIKGLAEIFCEEITAELLRHAVQDTGNAVVGIEQCIVVAGISDDDV